MTMTGKGKPGRRKRADIVFMAALFLLCAVLSLQSFSPAYATEEETLEEIVTEDAMEPGVSRSEEEKNEVPDNGNDTGELHRESDYSGEPDAESEADGDFSPSRKQQAPVSRATGTVRGTAAETQELHSYKVTATGLPESGVSAVEAEIVNAEGTVLHTLALTAAGDWTAIWETANPTENYSVRMKSVFSPEGMDIADAWLCSTVMTEEPRRPGRTETAWVERSELTEGIYVFELQSQPGTLLAASDTRKQTYGYYYYPLTAENAVPENADSAARWSVSADYGAWNIENLGVPGCLSILQPASKSICAAFEETALSISFDNGVFRRQVNGVDTYLKFPGSTTTTTSFSSGSVFTAYQLTELTWYITGHSCELRFSENMSNRTTAVHVSLAVDGNIADRTKRFPFTVLLDGELLESFTLGNGEEYRLEEVPCGASLTVQEDEEDYTVVSVSGEQCGNGIFHIDELPPYEVNILFTNTLEGDIETGIVTENGPWLLLLGIAILSGGLMIGTSKIKFYRGGNKS